MKWVLIAAWIVLIALLGWVTRLAPPAKAQRAWITGPYVYGRLAVFLVHGTETDSRRYLTLDEGLRSGEVVVKEIGRGQVNRLDLENRSARPLFLQDGDRLSGGKQDRIIGSSQVVLPRSGRVSVESFCIERGRWTSHDGSMSFTSARNCALATNAVRYAGNVEASQARVWEEVEAEKARVGLRRTSSLSDVLDDPTIEAQATRIVVALQSMLDRTDDVVGAAFAINGEVLEAAFYPSSDLFAKIYPRLLLTYAIEATLATGNERTATTEDVERFIRSEDDAYTLRIRGSDTPPRDDTARPGPRPRTTLNIKNPDGTTRQMCVDNCSLESTGTMLSTATRPGLKRETTYQGAVVHRQWLRRR